MQRLNQNRVKINGKTETKIERKRDRESSCTAHHCSSLLAEASPAHQGQHCLLPPARRRSSCVPDGRRATLAPPCLRAPRPPGRLHVYHAASSTLSHSPSSSSPPLARSLTPTEHARHHRRRPPWLPRPPRPTTVSPSSVVLLFLSSSTHATPGAAERHPVVFITVYVR